MTIDELLTGVQKAYIEDQTNKGIRASGKSASTLRKESTESSGTLYGAKYFYQQKHGRKPGKFPPIDSIIEWIRAKGIVPRETTERSLAFIIARKIAQQGTDIYLKRREGINVDDKVKELVKKFQESLSKDIRLKLTKSLS